MSGVEICLVPAFGGPCGRRKGHDGHHATIAAHHLDEKDDLRAEIGALQARLRREVDAHRMALHPRAVPFTDEEWAGYLAGIPGLEGATE